MKNVGIGILSSKFWSSRFWNAKFRVSLFLLIFAICHLPFAVSCSMPNLEQPECAASKQTVKEFYSNHFGNEMKFSQANLKSLSKFLTPEYFNSLQNLQTDADIFTTNNTDYPKAFRIGKCEIISPEKTKMEIQLFWRDDTRSEQKSIYTEVVKQNDQWLVNKVLN